MPATGHPLTPPGPTQKTLLKAFSLPFTLSLPPPPPYTRLLPTAARWMCFVALISTDTLSRGSQFTQYYLKGGRLCHLDEVVSQAWAVSLKDERFPSADM
jgi:hypothetical protein